MENRVLGSGQWATKRAIKGSLPSPAIKELLLQRNYLGNETNLKLTACGKPSVHYMRSHIHIHSDAHTHRRFGLRALAALFYMHSSLHTQLGALCTHTDTCVLFRKGALKVFLTPRFTLPIISLTIFFCIPYSRIFYFLFFLKRESTIFQFNFSPTLTECAQNLINWGL